MDNLGMIAAIIGIVLVSVGALLGGAIAHWRRGAGYIITGAIIGGALMFIPAALIAFGMVYALYIVIAAAAIVALVIFFGIFG